MGATHFSGPVVSAAGFVGATIPSTGLVGTGITASTGDRIKITTQAMGDVVYTQITVDVQGMHSSTTDLDIIGVVGTNPAYILKTTSIFGTIFSGAMTCVEAPATGVTDIDLYYADEATGVEDGGVAALTETAAVTAGAAWTLAKSAAFTGWPPANKYLYLTCGAAGTVGTYTAGKFMIELWGHKVLS